MHMSLYIKHCKNFHNLTKTVGQGTKNISDIFCCSYCHTSLILLYKDANMSTAYFANADTFYIFIFYSTFLLVYSDCNR